MRTLETQIEIAAPPEQVWRHLMDFASYPNWNPFVLSIKGSASLGSKLRVKLSAGGKRSITLRTKVSRYQSAREFAWKGSLPGLFAGEHQFHLTSIGDDAAPRTRLVHREDFSGLLVPLLWKRFLDRDTRANFEAMNRALKTRAEG